MHGSHCIKHWATTESTLSLSSGESELHGIAKGVQHALGIKSMCADIGGAKPHHVHSDATAALGIACRQGLGKLRHLDVEDLLSYIKLSYIQFLGPRAQRTHPQSMLIIPYSVEPWSSCILKPKQVEPLQRPQLQYEDSQQEAKSLVTCSRRGYSTFDYASLHEALYKNREEPSLHACL